VFATGLSGLRDEPEKRHERHNMQHMLRACENCELKNIFRRENKMTGTGENLIKRSFNVHTLNLLLLGCLKRGNKVGEAEGKNLQ
jgi:hypothetical protein